MFAALEILCHGHILLPTMKTFQKTGCEELKMYIIHDYHNVRRLW